VTVFGPRAFCCASPQNLKAARFPHITLIPSPSLSPLSSPLSAVNSRSSIFAMLFNNLVAATMVLLKVVIVGAAPSP